MKRIVHVVSACVVLLSPACRRATENRAPPAQPSAVVAADPSRLPEDPVAGKAAEKQWREHLEEEERERQMAFDAERMKDHRAVVALLTAARTEYDRAGTAAALGKARADVTRRVADIRNRVAELDRHANSSHLLKDYDALQTLLSGEYADARAAALQGDGRPLGDAQARFDRHTKAIADWLEEVEEEEKEAKEAKEEEREREHARSR